MHTIPLRTIGALLVTALVVKAQDNASTPDLSGKTDASIRAVVDLVARHQIHPLKDGEYPPATTSDEATQATPPEGVMWNYPWGVALYGEIRSFDATGDKDVLNFAIEHDHIIGRYYAWLHGVEQKMGESEWKAFVKENKGIKIGGLLRLGNLDSCGAMGVQMMEGMLRYPDRVIPEEKPVVERIANWIANKQDRLPDGTLWRPHSHDENGAWPNGTIWADDLYMACPFLVRWSEYTGDPKYLTDAAQQIINMAGRLQDKDGVWFHAYCEPKHEHSPFKWGRANGWIAVASAEVLSKLPENHPLRAKLLEIHRRHIDGIIKLQADDGLWHQVLDHPEVWEETSCTGMFAYAIARGVNRGWFPADYMQYARKAFAGLCTQITPDGIVKNTCQGTNIGFKLEYYVNRTHPDDDPHSRGIVQLAGTEIVAGKK